MQKKNTKKKRKIRIMSKLSVILFLILIVGFSAIMGFVLSEQQTIEYVYLDFSPQEPYAYNSTYAVDMGFEEPFGLRTFEDQN